MSTTIILSEADVGKHTMLVTNLNTKSLADLVQDTLRHLRLRVNGTLSQWESTGSIQVGYWGSPCTSKEMLCPDEEFIQDYLRDNSEYLYMVNRTHRVLGIISGKLWQFILVKAQELNPGFRYQLVQLSNFSL